MEFGKVLKLVLLACKSPSRLQGLLVPYIPKRTLMSQSAGLLGVQSRNGRTSL